MVSSRHHPAIFTCLKHVWLSGSPVVPRAWRYRKITCPTSNSTELLLYYISEQEGNNETFPFPFVSLVFVFGFQYRKLSSQYLKGMNERKVVHERASRPLYLAGRPRPGESRWLPMSRIAFCNGTLASGVLTACVPDIHLSTIEVTLGLQTVCPVSLFSTYPFIPQMCGPALRTQVSRAQARSRLRPLEAALNFTLPLTSTFSPSMSVATDNLCPVVRIKEGYSHNV